MSLHGLGPGPTGVVDGFDSAFGPTIFPITRANLCWDYRPLSGSYAGSDRAGFSPEGLYGSSGRGASERAPRQALLRDSAAAVREHCWRWQRIG